jgi:hypothetical protein
MPVKKVANAENERPLQWQPDMERYLLQIDRQTKRSFKTPEAAQAMALEIKARFPILQVSAITLRGNEIKTPTPPLPIREPLSLVSRSGRPVLC